MGQSWDFGHDHASVSWVLSNQSGRMRQLFSHYGNRGLAPLLLSNSLRFYLYNIVPFSVCARRDVRAWTIERGGADHRTLIAIFFSRSNLKHKICSCSVSISHLCQPRRSISNVQYFKSASKNRNKMGKWGLRLKENAVFTPHWR